jgi:hypothetical protein
MMRMMNRKSRRAQKRNRALRRDRERNRRSIRKCQELPTKMPCTT